VSTSPNRVVVGSFRRRRRPSRAYDALMQVRDADHRSAG